MKKTKHSSWIRAILAGVALLGSTALIQAQVVGNPTGNFTNTFDSGTSGPPNSSRQHLTWFGITSLAFTNADTTVTPGAGNVWNNNQIEFDPTMDAGGNPSSGSMKIFIPFNADRNNNFPSNTVPITNGASTPTMFGTFDNNNYGNSIRTNARYYTNMSVKIFVDPSVPTNAAGNFGNMTMNPLIVNTPNGGAPFSTPVTIPGSASGAWQTLNFSLLSIGSPAAWENPGAMGYVWRYLSVNNSLSNQYPYSPMTFWLDDLRMDVTAETPAPLPGGFMTNFLFPAYQGLNFVAAPLGTAGDFNRQSLRTAGTALLESYGWYQSGGEATYSFTISGWPGPGHQGFQFHTWMVADPLIGNNASQSQPDGRQTNVLFLDLDALADGGARWTFRWKSNSVSTGNNNVNNGQFFNPIDGGVNGPYAAITNSTGLGKWTVKFLNDTNVTMTTPSGTSTNFNIDPNLAALFPNPIWVYFGIMPDSQTQANKGRAIALSEIIISTTAHSISNNFMVETALDPLIWQTRGQGGGTVPIYFMPTNAVKLISWTGGAYGDQHRLQTNTILDGSIPWSTNGLPNPIANGPLYTVPLAPENIPAGPNAYFRTIRPTTP